MMYWFRLIQHKCTYMYFVASCYKIVCTVTYYMCLHICHIWYVREKDMKRGATKHKSCVQWHKICVSIYNVYQVIWYVREKDMKRAATRHLLWGGLLLYCLANTATFVLFVTHLVQVKQTNMHVKDKQTNNLCANSHTPWQYICPI